MISQPTLSLHVYITVYIACHGGYFCCTKTEETHRGDTRHNPGGMNRNFSHAQYVRRCCDLCVNTVQCKNQMIYPSETL